jgi:hypothetical protein
MTTGLSSWVPALALPARPGRQRCDGFTPLRLDPPYTLRERARYRTVLRSSTVLSNTRLMVQIQRLPVKASGYRQ